MGGWAGEQARWEGLVAGAADGGGVTGEESLEVVPVLINLAAAHLGGGRAANPPSPPAPPALQILLGWG